MENMRKQVEKAAEGLTEQLLKLGAGKEIKSRRQNTEGKKTSYFSILNLKDNKTNKQKQNHVRIKR